ncbi:hypothetical protein MRX96_034461 [Rhipicephalus microplus]
MRYATQTEKGHASAVSIDLLPVKLLPPRSVVRGCPVAAASVAGKAASGTHSPGWLGVDVARGRGGQRRGGQGPDRGLAAACGTATNWGHTASGRLGRRCRQGRRRSFALWPREQRVGARLQTPRASTKCSCAYSHEKETAHTQRF